jgi:hypothetical protein
VGEEIQTPCREIPISLRINLLNVSHIEVRLSAGFPGARDILETLDCFIVIRIPQRLGLTRRRHQEQNQNQEGFFHQATFRFLAAAILRSNSGRKCAGSIPARAKQQRRPGRKFLLKLGFWDVFSRV